MAKNVKRASALASRIAAGKADPISAEERAIVAQLRTTYETKYGRRQGARRTEATRTAYSGPNSL